MFEPLFADRLVLHCDGSSDTSKTALFLDGAPFPIGGLQKVRLMTVHRPNELPVSVLTLTLLGTVQQIVKREDSPDAK